VCSIPTTFSRIWALLIFVCSTSGKATLSKIVSESSSAEYWNTIPNFRRNVLSCRSFSAAMSVPSIRI